MVVLAGGTASGKTTVCDLVKQRLNDQCVVMLSQDSFYRGLTDEELENVTGVHLSCSQLHVMLRRLYPMHADFFAVCTIPPVVEVGSISKSASSLKSLGVEYNFDAPEAFDVESMLECMLALRVRQ